MGSENSLVEDAHVKNLRLFKCLNFQQEKDGLILFRIFTTEYYGQPGTQSEAFRFCKPKHIGFSLDPLFFRCLNDDLPLEEDEDEVFKTVKNTNCFGLEATRVLTQEISDYMRSCYRLYDGTFFGLVPESEVKNDFFMVIVVDVCMRTTTMDYVEAKLNVLSGIECFSPQDGQDAVKTSCDEQHDVGCSTRARVDDVNKGYEASGESSDVEIVDDVDDYDGCGVVDGEDDMDKDVTGEASNDMHVDDNSDDYDDDGEVGMLEDDDELDWYCFDESVEDCLCDIMEYVKQWKQVENDEEPIDMLEEKPLLTVEEMVLELMQDGNYKPLIDTINTNLVDVEDCSICISGFTENVPKSSTFPWCPKMNSSRIVRLGCGHVFHYHCVFKWLSKTPSCPLCRSSSLVYV